MKENLLILELHDGYYVREDIAMHHPLNATLPLDYSHSQAEIPVIIIISFIFIIFKLFIIFLEL